MTSSSKFSRCKSCKKCVCCCSRLFMSFLPEFYIFHVVYLLHSQINLHRWNRFSVTFAFSWWAPCCTRWIWYVFKQAGFSSRLILSMIVVYISDLFDPFASSICCSRHVLPYHICHVMSGLWWPRVHTWLQMRKRQLRPRRNHCRRVPATMFWSNIYHI